MDSLFQCRCIIPVLGTARGPEGTEGEGPCCPGWFRWEPVGWGSMAVCHSLPVFSQYALLFTLPPARTQGAASGSHRRGRGGRRGLNGELNAQLFCEDLRGTGEIRQHSIDGRNVCFSSRRAKMSGLKQGCVCVCVWKGQWGQCVLRKPISVN